MKASVFANWLWLQVPICPSLPFTCDNIFFFPSGTRKVSLLRASDAETVKKPYIQLILWSRYFGYSFSMLWIQVLTVSHGRRHDL